MADAPGAAPVADEGKGLLAGGAVPEPEGLIVTCRGEPGAVGAERDADHRVLVSVQRDGLPAIGQVPHPGPDAAGEAFAVGAEGDLVDRIRREPTAELDR